MKEAKFLVAKLQAHLMTDQPPTLSHSPFLAQKCWMLDSVKLRLVHLQESWNWVTLLKTVEMNGCRKHSKTLILIWPTPKVLLHLFLLHFDLFPLCFWNLLFPLLWQKYWMLMTRWMRWICHSQIIKAGCNYLTNTTGSSLKT